MRPTSILIVGIVALTACARGDHEGVRSAGERIINGTLVPAASEIRKATVKISDTSLSGEQRICSGTIISSEAVITAAHCLYKFPVGQGDDEDSFEMRDYANLFLTFSSKGLEIVKPVSDIRAFGLPARGPGAHDLALLKFEGGLPAGVVSVALLDDESAIANGQEVSIAGFGKSTTSQPDPTVMLREGTMLVKKTDYSETEIELSKKDEAAQVTCEGDSGGPSFLVRDGKLILWGVLRGGDFMCGFQSVYTKVFAHLPWIHGALASWRAAPDTELN